MEINENDEYQLQIDKVGRLLSLNSLESLQDLTSLLTTLCRNILENPLVSKYRTIKLSNESIQRRLVKRSGGVEFLVAIGWRSLLREREPVLEFMIPVEPSSSVTAAPQPKSSAGNACNMVAELTKDQIARIHLAQQWLINSVQSLQEFHNSADRTPDTIIAECILQLRLNVPVSSSSSRLVAGFMRGDTLSAVYRFVHAYFLPTRRGAVLLRLPDTAAVLGEDNSQHTQTLESLGLCPRSTLLVGVKDDIERATVLQSVHEAAIEREKVEKLVSTGKSEIAIHRKEKEKAERALERERALAAFKDDRLEKTVKHTTSLDKDH